MKMLEKGMILHEVLEKFYNNEFEVINGKIVFDLNPYSEEWRLMTPENREKINIVNDFFN